MEGMEAGLGVASGMAAVACAVQREQELIGLKPGLLRLSVGYTGDDEEMQARFLRCRREAGLAAAR